MPKQILAILGLALALAGCTQYKPVESLPAGQSAYSIMDSSADVQDAQPYRISPEDLLNVNVFFEPELSVDEVKVDRTGQIALPGIGSMIVEGLTTQELASKIEASLRGRLLERPQVAVSVVASARQKVVVTGEVQRAGVYDLRGNATLMEAIALAQGETELSKLDEVVVFRTIDGQKMAARFDVGAIRSGASPDPRILGDDIVVVGYSAARALWRDIRQMAPIIGVFRPLYN